VQIHTAHAVVGGWYLVGLLRYVTQMLRQTLTIGALTNG